VRYFRTGLFSNTRFRIHFRKCCLLTACIIPCVYFKYFVRSFFFNELLDTCNTRYRWSLPNRDFHSNRVGDGKLIRSSSSHTTVRTDLVYSGSLPFDFSLSIVSIIRHTRVAVNMRWLGLTLVSGFEPFGSILS